MKRPFDIALFLTGVLTGSKAAQQRHLRQARIMQTAIQQRWNRDNPWAWQLKHINWFFSQHLANHSNASRYYYKLTALMVWRRMGSSQTLTIPDVIIYSHTNNKKTHPAIKGLPLS